MNKLSPGAAVLSPMFYARNGKDRQSIGILTRCTQADRNCAYLNNVFNPFSPDQVILERWIAPRVKVSSVSQEKSLGFLNPGVPSVLARIDSSLYRAATSPLANGAAWSSGSDFVNEFESA